MLEPIEEGDLNLENKFSKGGLANKGNFEAGGISNQTEVEKIPNPSENLERKEGLMEKDDAYNKILAKVKSPTTVVHNDVSVDAKLANDQADYESKVLHLVQIAEAKGIVHAVKVAKHLEDNYLLDELHDRLLGEDLHEALVRKGMINEF